MEFISNIKIFENVKQGKQYVQSGKLDQETLDSIIAIDPSKTKKYVGWLAKQAIVSGLKASDMKSYIEEYDVIAGKGKAERNDITQFKSFDELKKYVDELNARGTASLKELENDYDVVRDDEDLYIASPNTHEASRKLGLTVFAHRTNDKGEVCDSTWCTTYKNNSHFMNYFYKQNVTFYYTLVRNKQMLQDLNKIRSGNAFEKIAFAVMPNGEIDAYDADDRQISGNELNKVREIIGI